MRSMQAVVAAACLAVAASAQSSFTYQGTLKSGGSVLEGNADMTFKLFGSPAGNDQISATLPVNGVSVDHGLFTVVLDFGGGAFLGDDRWLEIAVNGTTLSPRQQVTEAPYAMFSQNTRGVSVNTSGDVGIGNSSPSQRLTVGSFSDPDTFARIETFGAHAGLQLRNFSGRTGWTIASDESSPSLGLDIRRHTIDETGVTAMFIDRLSGNVGIGTTNPSAPMSLGSGNANTKLAVWDGGVSSLMGLGVGPAQFRLHLPNSTNRFSFLDAPDGNELVTVQGGGNVGIGTTAPKARLHVAGDMKIDGANTLEFGAGVPGKQNDAGKIGYQTFTSALDIVGAGTNGTNRKIQFYAEGGSNFTGGASFSGNVGIGTATPNAPLSFGIGIGNTRLALWDGGPSNVMGLGVGAGQFRLHLPNSSNRFSFLDASDGNELVTIQGGGNVGIGTDDPKQKLDVNGWVRTHAVQIVGGSDIAEPFDISDADGLAPGMVVSIDPDRVGELRPSTVAYDKSVAGVVSGANGIRPGLMLAQEDNPQARGKHLVALSGRVWVYVDADAGGPVAPGDMLTTSATRGHAMRAGDNARAPGAVIGKAMSSLERGTGLVLVLVSLQ